MSCSRLAPNPNDTLAEWLLLTAGGGAMENSKPTPMYSFVPTCSLAVSEPVAQHERGRRRCGGLAIGGSRQGPARPVAEEAGLTICQESSRHRRHAGHEVYRTVLYYTILYQLYRVHSTLFQCIAGGTKRIGLGCSLPGCLDGEYHPPHTHLFCSLCVPSYYGLE